ncbi:hypothetical protein HK096_000141, partial [Nowakowskiella sp. JEL0078]
RIPNVRLRAVDFLPVIRSYLRSDALRLHSLQEAIREAVLHEIDRDVISSWADILKTGYSAISRIKNITSTTDDFEIVFPQWTKTNEAIDSQRREREEKLKSDLQSETITRFGKQRSNQALNTVSSQQMISNNKKTQSNQPHFPRRNSSQQQPIQNPISNSKVKPQSQGILRSKPRAANLMDEKDDNRRSLPQLPTVKSKSTGNQLAKYSAIDHSNSPTGPNNEPSSSKPHLSSSSTTKKSTSDFAMNNRGSRNVVAGSAGSSGRTQLRAAQSLHTSA